MSPRAALLTAALLAAPAALAESPPPGERTLLVVLDAIPYRTLERLMRGPEGLFRDFPPPVPLVSTFPSTTSVALPAILAPLGLEPSPGYEARIFDRDRGRRRGGGPRSYFRIPFPWRTFFDWRRPGPLRNAWHAARPVRSGIREFERALDSFAADDRPLYTVYVADTDTAGHLGGPTGLDPMLRAADAALTDLRRRTGPFRAILLSDHGLAGGDPLANVLPGVRRALDNGGWRRGARLRRPRDVVLTPYGLVSSFEAYCAAGEEIELAQALAAVDGVEFCAARDEERWRIEAAGASIRVENGSDGDSGANRWRWRVRGDRSVPIAAALAAAGDEDRWIDDAVLFTATATGPYPDPLRRIADAFTAVDHPASVICSVGAGYLYGARGTERTARWTKGRLRWTHGSLGRDASLGFLLAESGSTAYGGGPPPGALRYDRALETLVAPSP